MINNKKAITSVVATVLIIMLTVSAIALLAGFVVPFVKNSLNKGTECINYRNFYTFDESFELNCYQSSSATGEALYILSVKTGSDKMLANNSEEFRIVLTSKSGMANTISVKSGSEASHNEGGVWILGSNQNLRVPSPGGIVSYVYNGTNEEMFESAEIYPVLKSGRICEEKDSINLVRCGSKIV